MPGRPTTPSGIRRQLLKSRKAAVVELTKPVKVRRRRYKPPVDDPRKTLTIKLLEMRFNKPIEKLLVEDGPYRVAKKLGVKYNTVYKWKCKFGLN